NRDPSRLLSRRSRLTGSGRNCGLPKVAGSFPCTARKQHRRAAHLRSCELTVPAQKRMQTVTGSRNSPVRGSEVKVERPASFPPGDVNRKVVRHPLFDAVEAVECLHFAERPARG